MDPLCSAQPMQTSAPCKAGRGRRADMGNPEAGARETSGARQAGRDRSPNVRNRYTVQMMKIAPAEAVMHSATGKTGSDCRRAGAGIRHMNACGAKTTLP